MKETSEEMEALARRAVAAGFKARVGCVGTVDGVECVVVGVYGDLMVYSDEWAHTRDVPRADFLPDLSGPATLGCLLALVREAWGERGRWAYMKPERNNQGVPFGWEVMDNWWITMGRSATEAAALVAALEAAPK